MINLNDKASRFEASELLRGLVSEVRLHSDDGAEDGHVIELYGELAAILELSGSNAQNTAVLRAGYRLKWLRKLDLDTVFEN